MARRPVALTVALATAVASLTGIAVQLNAAKAASAGPGAYDETFGANGVFQADLIPGGTNDRIVASAIGFNNRPLIAAYDTLAARKSWVARLTSNGRLDTSFGTNGLASIDLSSLTYPSGSASLSNPIDVAVDFANRTLVLTTLGTTTGANYFIVTRFTDTGALDTSFGSGGSLVGDFVGTDVNLARSIAVDDLNGIIYVAGSYRPNGGGNDTAAIRRIAFDGNYFSGTTPTWPGVGQSSYTDIEVDVAHNRQPVVVGWVAGVAGMPADDTFDPVVNRFNLDGTYDASYAPFAGNGRIPIYKSNEGEEALGLDIDYSGGGTSFAVHDFTTGRSTDLVYRLDLFGNIPAEWNGGQPTNLGSDLMPVATRWDSPDSIAVVGQKFNAGSNTFLTRLGSDGQEDSSYLGSGASWSSPTSARALSVDSARRAVVVTDINSAQSHVARFTADRADGPALPNKWLIDETGVSGHRSIYGLSPDARDLVGLEDGDTGISNERPVASQNGVLLFEQHDVNAATVQVMKANAGDGGNVVPLNPTDFLVSNGFATSRPTVGNGDNNVMYLVEDAAHPEDGKCVWFNDLDVYGGSPSSVYNACNVTDAAMNPLVTGWLAFIRNGDIFLTDTSGYSQYLVVSGANATRIEWGADGLLLAYDDNSVPGSHSLKVLTYESYNAVSQHYAPLGPTTAVTNNTPFTSFVLAPELSTDRPLAFTVQDANGTQLDIAALDGSLPVAGMMRGANIRLGGWSRNLSVYPPDGPTSAIEPSSVGVNELPIAPHSPQAQDQVNAGNKAAAGLLQLKLLKSPILQLKLLKSQLLQLKLLKSPVGLAPLGLSSDLGGSPLVQQGLKQISLQQLQLTGGATWQQRLSAPGMSDEAIRLAKEPLQNVSLFDVLQLSPQIDFPSLGELDLTQGPLGQVPVLVFLLGDTRLTNIGGIDWCGVFEARGAANCGADYGVPGSALQGRSASLFSLYVAGFNLDDLPRTDGHDNDLRSITYDQVNLDPARALLPNIIVGADGNVDTYQASVGSARIAQVTPSPSAVAYCDGDPNPAPAGVTPIDCGGEATVYTARTSGALHRDATVGDLGDALRGYPLNELALGVWGDPGDDPYDRPPAALGVNPTLGQEQGQRFSINFARMAAGPAATEDPVLNALMPAGYEYRAGTAFFTNSADGLRVALPDPSISFGGRNLRWTIPTVLDNGQHLSVEFSASPVANVSGQLIVTIDDGFQSQQVGSEDLQAVDANESDDPSSSPRIDPDKLYFGRLDSADDVDYFRIPLNSAELDIAPGSTINVYLSQLRYDADLTVYHPEHSDRGLPLRPATSDLVDIHSVADKAPEIVNKGEALGDASQYDVPLIDGLPVAGISDNRGTKAEKVTSFVWPGSTDVNDSDNDAAHRYLVQVSGFNGAHGPETYAVRYTVTPPPITTDGNPRPSAFGNGASAAPAPLGADVDTLILTNPTRLAALYPGREGIVAGALPQLASDTNGAVFPVDSSPTVRAAYAAWDAKPGDVEAANAVVRAINAAVDAFVGGHRSALKSIIVVGTDEVIPMARLQDLTQFASERTFAQDLRQLAGNSGGNNALYASALAGKILSDDPYGAFAPRKFDGEWLYVPDVALGRLVETPEDIAGQINEFHAPAQDGDPVGSIRPTSTLSVGADFMTRMAAAIQTAFNTPLFGSSHDTLISQTWSRSDLSAKIGTAAPSIVSINTHYSPFELAPASRLDSAHPDNPNLSASQLGADADFRRRLLFTMGCHSGFSVTDYLGSTQPDFAQVLSAESASGFIGNTGFGLGVKEYDAFSQQLFTKFASLLAEYDFGTALQQAKQQYLANGITSPYDLKVLAEATYFGIPQYKVVGAAPIVPAPNDTPAPDPQFGGTKAASVVLNQPTSSAWTKNTTADGSVYDLTTADAGHAIVQDRPVQPSRGSDVTATNDNLRAAGAFIDVLEVGATEDNFDPVLARPQLASGTTSQPEVRPASLISPARLADITHYLDGQGRDRQHLVIVPAQFASTGTNAAGDLIGTETRFSKVGIKVLYQDVTDPDYIPDTTPPTATRGSAVFSPSDQGSLLSLHAEDNESGIVRVVALWKKDSESAFHLLDLAGDDSGDYSAFLDYNGADLQVFFEVVNGASLVQVFQDKGAAFIPSYEDTVTASYDRTPTSATGPTFDGPVTVHFTETGPADLELLQISVDGGPEQTYTDNDVALQDDGEHVITYRSTTGDAEGSVRPIIATPVRADAVAVSYSRPLVDGVFPGPVTVHLAETPTDTGITSTVTDPAGHTTIVNGPDVELTEAGTYTVAYETGAGTTGVVMVTIQPAGADAVEVIPSATPRNSDGAYLGPVILKFKETPIEDQIMLTVDRDGAPGTPVTYPDNRLPLSDAGHYVVHYVTYQGTQGTYVLDIVSAPVDEHVTVSYDTPATNSGFHTAATNATVASDTPGSIVAVTVNGNPSSNPVRLGDPAFPATAGDGIYTIGWSTSLGTNGSEQVKVDTHAPQVSITAPADNSTFLLHQGVTPTVTCTDVFLLTTDGCVNSGVDTSTVTNGIDRRTFTVTGTDAADHQSQASTQYAVTYAPSGPCAGYAGHTVIGYSATSSVKVGLLQQINLAFAVCDANGAPVDSSQPPPAVGPPVEVNANGSIIANAKGGCAPLLGLIPICIIQSRQTQWTYNGRTWNFKQDTLGLSLGYHTFRVLLADGSYMDYRFNKVLLK